jgi:hypothetical protein
MRIQFRQPRPLAILLVAVLVAGCGSSAASTPPAAGVSAGRSLATAGAASASPRPSGTATGSATSSQPPVAASPNPSDLAVFATIESQVEALRGLQASTRVTPILLDSGALADWMTRTNAAETDHLALANESRLFIHMGLLPAGSSLEQLELALDSGQVIGFYDPVSKGLYVLSQSGGIGPVEKVTFAHEYTHALQDQNFGLGKLAIDTPDQGDRDLARTSLPEGDATLLMTSWMTKYLSPADLLMIALNSGSAAQAEQLAEAPAILRQTLLFPYQQGLAFVQGVYAAGGWSAVDQLYSRPPDSTSQILHPELYASRVEPLTVVLPPVPAGLGSGWQLTMQDTLGEFQLAVWLEGEQPTTAQTAAATSATSTWAGDRVGLYEGPNGAWAVVLRTDWRTAAGSQAFWSAASLKASGMSGASRVCDASNGVSVVLASNQTILPLLSTCS